MPDVSLTKSSFCSTEQAPTVQRARSGPEPPSDLDELAAPRPRRRQRGRRRFPLWNLEDNWAEIHMRWAV